MKIKDQDKDGDLDVVKDQPDANRDAHPAGARIRSHLAKDPHARSIHLHDRIDALAWTEVDHGD